MSVLAVVVMVVNWTSDWTCAVEGKWQKEQHTPCSIAAGHELCVCWSLCVHHQHCELPMFKGFVSWSLLPTGNVSVLPTNRHIDVSVTSTQPQYQFNCLLLFSCSLSFSYFYFLVLLLMSSSAQQLLPCLVSRFLWSAEKTNSSADCVFIPIAAAAVWLQSAICRCVRTTAMHRYKRSSVLQTHIHTHSLLHSHTAAGR